MMTMITAQSLVGRKNKIAMVTCYDTWSARLLDETSIDILLVGDSLAMVMDGHSSTLPATVARIETAVQAVARGASKKIIVADMPFLSFRLGVTETLRAAGTLMQAGAHAVKIEGVSGHEDSIERTVQSGIPVMGHLGLTPQSFHQFGGMKVQGRDEAKAKEILADAKRLQELGAFGVVLECMPRDLARVVSEELEIPTIGIGAGPDCDGQVLVLHDLLGLNTGFRPKFLRTYLDGGALVRGAVEKFSDDVREGRYPNDEESYR